MRVFPGRLPAHRLHIKQEVQSRVTLKKLKAQNHDAASVGSLPVIFMQQTALYSDRSQLFQCAKLMSFVTAVILNTHKAAGHRAICLRESRLPR
jgi:hypothetical protein